jgi:trans-2,3-dihydro-3-hydroxyanthranilate isomerase
MPFYHYLHLDVFTDTLFAGNQLAVFPDAAGLEPKVMQQIAREINFSETTFVFPPEADGTDVRMRIFTPFDELPVAGHPTIGSTFALAHLGTISPSRGDFVFGLGAGPTPVALEWDDTRLSFAWMTQLRPTFGRTFEDVEGFAAALGVDTSDITSSGLPIQEVSCGVPFVYVPMATRAAVDAASADVRRLGRAFADAGAEQRGVFLFAVGSGGDDVTAYSRMFAPLFGIAEDPATGIASGPLGSYLVHHRVIPVAQAGAMVSLQGAKMGRPSVIHISIDADGDQITRVRVGGKAVLVAEGTLTVA